MPAAEISTASPPSISLLLQQANRHLYHQKEKLYDTCNLFFHTSGYGLICFNASLSPFPRRDLAQPALQAEEAFHQSRPFYPKTAGVVIMAGNRASFNKYLAHYPNFRAVYDTNRYAQEVPPSSTRTELHRYARDEFERHRGVSDVQHIRYLLSTGKAEFETMRRYIDEQIAG